VDYNKMDLGEIRWDGTDWIDVFQDRDYWRPLMNMVMNLRVPKIPGKSSVDIQLAASQVELSSMMLVMTSLTAVIFYL
jgi:hypothetical protein